MESRVITKGKTRIVKHKAVKKTAKAPKTPPKKVEVKDDSSEKTPVPVKTS